MQPGDEGWHSPVKAPQELDSPEAIEWDREADLLVVGFGGAGATAALRARQQGLAVIAIDKADGGGATLASGGVIYAGGGTGVQREEGESDSPENMFNYLRLETGGVVGDETLLRFCEQSAANLEWLADQGVRFSGPVWKSKTSYPNVDYFLYHADNSLLPEYMRRASPAARGHRGVMRKGRSAVNLGGSIFNPLKARCEAGGVRIDTRTAVEQLIVCDERVVGLRAWRLPPDADGFREYQRCQRLGRLITRLYPFFLPGARRVHALADRYFARAARLEEAIRQPVTYRARRGVCLSAGGFIFNRDMVGWHCPAYEGGMPLGTPSDDGSGIRLGESVGGATDLMAHASAWRFINPPLAWSQGVLVDTSGARFVNECCYGATIGDAMVNRAGGRALLLLDDDLVKAAWRQIRPSRVLPFQWQLGALNMLFGKKKFPTLAALCGHYGFNQDRVSETLEETRRVAAGEGDDPFGKPREDVKALRFPLHVIDVSLDARLLPCAVMTLGGLRVDEDTGQVRRRNGGVVPGLYAAGRTAVGLPSRLYVSGLSIADCVFSGLRAADHASAD